MIIYEVNIQVDKRIYNDYILWLNPHIEKMLTFNGFIKVKKFINKNSTNDIKNVIIHYYISSKDDLNYYLSNNAHEMRTEMLDEFTDKVNINRRVLEML